MAAPTRHRFYRRRQQSRHHRPDRRRQCPFAGADTGIAIQSGANTVINFGGGNSVTLQDVTEANLIASDFDFSPAPNHSPTDILLSNHTVAEGSANGTLIGNLSAVDSDQDDTFVYSLIDSAGGKFSLNGVNLLVAGGLHGASYDVVFASPTALTISSTRR